MFKCLINEFNMCIINEFNMCIMNELNMSSAVLFYFTTQKITFANKN